MHGKRPVWILFRVLELILSMVTCSLHLNCISLHASRHIFVLCTTYGGGTIFAVLGLFTLLISTRISLRNEAICSGIFGFLCLFAIYMNMHMGTKDKIQPFLMSHELVEYGVIRCCKISAQLSICSAAVYLLHCSLAMDMLLTHPLEAVGGNAPTLPPLGEQRPLQLFFISREVESHLKNYRWFQLLSTNIIRRRSTYTEPSDKNTSQTVTNM